MAMGCDHTYENDEEKGISMKRVLLCLLCLCFMGYLGYSDTIKKEKAEIGYLDLDAMSFKKEVGKIAPWTSFANPQFLKVEERIQTDVENGFPGAVLLVEQGGEIVYFKSFGYLKKYDENTLLDQPVPLQIDTMFDIASLTKIYSTTLALMKLYDEGKIALDDRVCKYLPAFDKSPYDQITIRHLLTHTSGLPADFQFFRETGDYFSKDREKTITLLDDVSLINSVGTKQVYSDIGFMILGTVVEVAANEMLDSFVSNKIYKPLGIDSMITYKPLEHGIAQNTIACTECRGNTRGGTVDFSGIRAYTLQGEVHDEKAYYSMGGVSGHAGLFANAQAINTLNQVLLHGVTAQGIALFSEDTIHTFTAINTKLRHQLGFANAATYKTLAPVVSKQALCHNGWTGTFSLIDYEKDLSIVLLTNKRHSLFKNQAFAGSAFDTGQYYSITADVYACLQM